MSNKNNVPNSRQQPIRFNQTEKEMKFVAPKLDFYTQIQTDSRSEETVKKAEMNDRRPVSLNYGSGYAREGNKYDFSTTDKPVNRILDEMFGDIEEEEPFKTQTPSSSPVTQSLLSTIQRPKSATTRKPHAPLNETIEYKQRIRKLQRDEVWCNDCKHIFEVVMTINLMKDGKTNWTSCPGCKKTISF